MRNRQPGPTLFDAGRDEMLEPGQRENFHYAEARVDFLAGILSAWTLGPFKPKEVERDQFKYIAREALERANNVRRSQ